MDSSRRTLKTVVIGINRDRGEQTFEEIAQFVDEARALHPQKTDKEIDLVWDEDLSDHEDVFFYVEGDD